MTLYALLSGTLATIEAEPCGTCLARVTVAGALPVGRKVVLGERWHLSAAGAWTAEARRLSLEADRAAHRARAASIEAEALERQAGVAMGRAVEARGEAT